MEIKPNISIGPASLVTVSQAKARQAQAEIDSAAFEGVAALTEALRATPRVRPEVVAQAQQLIGDVKYPPAEIIRGIVTLCAMNLENPKE